MHPDHLKDPPIFLEEASLKQLEDEISKRHPGGCVLVLTCAQPKRTGCTSMERRAFYDGSLSWAMALAELFYQEAKKSLMAEGTEER